MDGFYKAVKQPMHPFISDQRLSYNAATRIIPARCSAKVKLQRRELRIAALCFSEGTELDETGN
jgi:hypothetical protein